MVKVNRKELWAVKKYLGWSTPYTEMDIADCTEDECSSIFDFNRKLGRYLSGKTAELKVTKKEAEAVDKYLAYSSTATQTKIGNCDIEECDRIYRFYQKLSKYLDTQLKIN